jgi:hypothetical protein
MWAPPAAVVEAVVAAFKSVSVWLRLSAARNERRQTIDVVARGLHRGLMLRAVVALIAIVIALLIGLRIPLLELRLLLLRLRRESRFLPEIRIAFSVVTVVVLRGRGFAFRARLLLRLVLAELLLRSRDQTKIMLGVLVVVFGSHRIAGRARVTRKLHILLGDVRSGPADFDIRSVGFENPGHRILAAAVIIVIVVIVAATHTLVVIRTVSHFEPSIDS